MASDDKAITDLTVLSAFASGDKFVVVDVSSGAGTQCTGTVILAWIGASLDMSTIASGGALPVLYGGTGVTTKTGTGNVVLSTSPTLVTPALGTPASGVLTNATGYPGDSSLVTSGALNSGSITSGFGSIDIGSSTITTTGLITGGDLTLNADNPDIIGGDTDGVLSITADTATDQGGNIKLYGNTHATKAQDIEFYADATLVGDWDESAGEWTFSTAINVPAIKTASGALTVTPAAGSDVAIVTSGAGDFVVNTTQLVVDASEARVGVGTASPSYTLHVVGTSTIVAKVGRSTAADTRFLFGNSVGDMTLRADASGNGEIYGDSGKTLGLGANGSAAHLKFTTAGYIGVGVTATAWLHTKSSTTSAASLNIPSGTAPTSPNNGDIWSDGSDIFVRLGGVTYTLNKT